MNRFYNRRPKRGRPKTTTDSDIPQEIQDKVFAMDYRIAPTIERHKDSPEDLANSLKELEREATALYESLPLELANIMADVRQKMYSQ